MISVIIVVKSTLPEGSATPGLIISLIERRFLTSGDSLSFNNFESRVTLPEKGIYM